ncbi:DUF6328 family protein [Kitasatospora phosalacinea]|uniref:DUF6328 family protein n=1 Tax=Kitasatospora phosalacinea TaxID=2065 RepID=UPI00365A48A8
MDGSSGSPGHPGRNGWHGACPIGPPPHPRASVGACATASLIAPVAFHRLLAGHGLEPVPVRAGSRLIGLGLALLALTIGCALLLLLRAATVSACAARSAAAAAGGGAAGGGCVAVRVGGSRPVSRRSAGEEQP